MSRFQTVKRKSLNFLRQTDAFGHPISLTYKSNSTYKSVLGGLFTTLSRVALLVYFFLQFNSVIKKQGQTITTRQFYENMFEPTLNLSLTVDNFDVAIGFYSWDLPDYSDIWFEYFSAQFYIYKSGYDSENKFYEEYIRIPSVICDETRFLGSKEIAKGLNFASKSLVCPDKSYISHLYGNYNSPNMEGFQIYVYPCDQEFLQNVFPDQKKKCKKYNQTLEIANTIGVDTNYLIQYFDSMDFQNPIKISSKYFATYFDSKVIANRILKTSQVALELHDSLISSSLGVKDIYYLDHNLVESTSALPTDPELFGLSVFFMINEQHQNLVRSIDTIVVVLSETGGFMSMMYIAIQALIGSLQEKLFFQSLIKKMYLVRKRANIATNKPTDFNSETQLKTEHVQKNSLSTQFTLLREATKNSKDQIPQPNNCESTSTSLIGIKNLFKQQDEKDSGMQTYQEQKAKAISAYLKLLSKPQLSQL